MGFWRSFVLIVEEGWEMYGADNEARSSADSSSELLDD
jgi:hypothetical protein